VTPVFASEVLVAQTIAFGLIAAAMIFAAVRVVTCRNLVHAALWLVTVLAGMAAQYILLAAEFVAVTQVLVYIGAIVVLFLFGIMLTRSQMGLSDRLDNPRQAKLVAGGVAVALLAVLGYALWDGFEDRRFGEISVQTTTQVSDAIFSTYLVPFEVVSVLLLAALIGAIVIARRD